MATVASLMRGMKRGDIRVCIETKNHQIIDLGGICL
jgi:hypothetical protein